MSVLSAWVVYDRPRDFPSNAVARRWMITGGELAATGDVIVAPSIEQLRALFPLEGLVRFPRMPEDDDVIVECWL